MGWISAFKAYKYTLSCQVAFRDMSVFFNQSNVCILYTSVVFFPSGVVFNDVYTASKFAMEGFCESMAVQLMKFNIR